MRTTKGRPRLKCRWKKNQRRLARTRNTPCDEKTIQKNRNVDFFFWGGGGGFVQLTLFKDRCESVDVQRRREHQVGAMADVDPHAGVGRVAQHVLVRHSDAIALFCARRRKKIINLAMLVYDCIESTVGW